MLRECLLTSRNIRLPKEIAGKKVNQFQQGKMI
jgi:hypothetical protein